MLRARHMPFSIGIAERDQWMACMQQAMAELGMEPGLAERLRAGLFGTADWMRNRAG
jgi:hemoglobin